jgi:hypothetical protein
MAAIQATPRAKTSLATQRLPSSTLPPEARVYAHSPIPTRADAQLAPGAGGALPQVGGEWRTTVFPSLRPSGREEVAQVERWLEEALAMRALATRPPRAGPTDRPRERAAPPPPPSLAAELADADRISALFAVLNQAMHELARQVAVACQERGRVLWRIWCLSCAVVEQLLAVIQRVRTLHGSALTDVQACGDDAKREAAELRERLVATSARADAADLSVSKLRAQYAALVSEGERLAQFGVDVKALIANRDERSGLIDKLRREVAAAAAVLELSHTRMRHYEKAAKQFEFERNASETAGRQLKERIVDLEAQLKQRDADARKQRMAAALAGTARTRLAAVAAAPSPPPSPAADAGLAALLAQARTKAGEPAVASAGGRRSKLALLSPATGSPRDA